jgi:hypothetical protein
MGGKPDLGHTRIPGRLQIIGHAALSITIMAMSMKIRPHLYK